MISLIRHTLVFCLCLLPFFGKGQQLSFPTDVIGNSVGFASTAWNTDATANANPAALGSTKGFQLSAAVRSRYLIEGLFDYGLFVSHQVNNQSSVGLQIEHFGFEQFRQQTFAGSYGRVLSDRWTLGLRFSYFRIAQEEQENASAISGSIGILYQLNDQVIIGTEINPFTPAFENDITLSVAQKAGISYQPSDIVSVYGDIHYFNDLPSNISIGVGFTYDIFESVNLALGYRSNPNQFSFGIGWQLSDGMMINLSSSFQQRLGASPMGGFIYSRQP